MTISRIAVAAAALTVLSAIAAPATSVVGTWKGKLSLDKSKLPPSVTADKVKQAQDYFAKMVFTLTLKKDGTYTSKIAGAPTAPGAPPPKPQTGKWSISGSDLTILIGTHPQKFTLAKNGKSFSASQASGVLITFTR
jgi:hypothetical protein